MQKFLSVRTAAEHLGVSQSAIYRWVSTGSIPHSKVGGSVRISESDLTSFYERNRRAE